ncbi:MAG: hypothetical protein HRT68_04750 [Flavobacteriaceae bacterium]|nr:hypothetical protein [Flavobacteriaceae bacterium]
MKNLVFLLLLFVVQIGVAQVGTVEEPSITPTTPEAAAVARYGDLDIMSATGQMSYSVPLHTISVDGNSWPVALNYSYNGLILEGKPSLSGLGWNLTAYGSVTREIRGLADGHPNGYYGINGIQDSIQNVVADYEDNGTFDTTGITTIRKFKNKEWDSEADKYTVSVGGLSFSFKLRKDAQGNVLAYYLSKHNHKVEITMSTSEYFKVGTMVVTSDTGVKYHFNETEAEYVIPEDPLTSELQGDQTTSWMLTKIEYLNGQEILFEYDDDDYISYDFVATAVSLYGNLEGDNFDGEVQYQTFDSDRVNKTDMKRQVLKKITFPSGTIDFNHALVPNTTNRRVFNSVVVRDANSKVINTYDFTYSGSRDNLTQIDLNGEFFYGFEYYGLGNLPNFVNDVADKPYAQDFWKFYNGQGGNNSAFSLGSSNYIANRSPFLYYTQLGALHKINYKTGGHTIVTYEQNEVKEAFNGTVYNQPLDQEFKVSLNPAYDNNEREITQSITFNTPVYAQVDHVIDGRLWDNYFSMTMSKTDGACNLNATNCYNVAIDNSLDYDDQAAYLRQHIVPGVGGNTCASYPTPILCLNYASDKTGPDDTTESDYFESGASGYIYIAAGTYEIKITTSPNNNSEYTFTNGSIYGHIRIKYHDASGGGGGNPLFVNKPIGGIRVAQLSDYNEHGSQTSVRSYNYNDSEGFSTGYQNQVPLYNDLHTWTYLDSNASPSNWTRSVEEHKQAAFTTSNASHGVPVYYKEVSMTHSLGNTKNAIAKQEYFMPMEGSGYYSYPRYPEHGDMTKSMPHIGNQYNGLDISLANPVSTTTQTYDVVRHALHGLTNQDLDSNHPVSFKMYKKLNLTIDFDANCYCNNDPAYGSTGDIVLRQLHDMKIYKEVVASRRVNQSDNTTDGILTSTSYTYDLKNLLQTTSTTDSKGQTITSEIDYPYEHITNPIYADMVTKNQIAIPVIQRSKLDGTLMSTQQTEFVLNVNGYKPEKISTAKGSNTLENKINFSYDGNGNIIEYDKNDGSSYPVAYIWGYDKQFPIAKIENATYSQIQSFVSNLQSLSDADVDATSEAALRDDLNDLRNEAVLANTYVTTYTYDPLVGVTSVTDPRGLTIYYEYDNLHRLKQVKDQDGNILSENEYNYRQAN